MTTIQSTTHQKVQPMNRLRSLVFHSSSFCIPKKLPWRLYPRQLSSRLHLQKFTTNMIIWVSTMDVLTNGVRSLSTAIPFSMKLLNLSVGKQVPCHAYATIFSQPPSPPPRAFILSTAILLLTTRKGRSKAIGEDLELTPPLWESLWFHWPERLHSRMASWRWGDAAKEYRGLCMFSFTWQSFHQFQRNWPRRVNVVSCICERTGERKRDAGHLFFLVICLRLLIFYNDFFFF